LKAKKEQEAERKRISESYWEKAKAIVNPMNWFS